MPVETTPGGITVISDPGATANSYASIAAAIARWALDPHKQDAPTDQDVIARALITATTDIGLQFGDEFRGQLYNNTYALFFPRTGLQDARGIDITDFTTFPVDLINATIEQAYWENRENRKQDSSTSLSEISEQELEGVGRVRYSSTSEQRQATALSTIKNETAQYLRPFILSGGTSSQYSEVLGRG